MRYALFASFVKSTNDPFGIARKTFDLSAALSTEVIVREAEKDKALGAPSLVFRLSVTTNVRFGVSILKAFASEFSVTLVTIVVEIAELPNVKDAISSLLTIKALSIPVAPVSQSYAKPPANFDIHAIIKLMYLLKLYSLPQSLYSASNFLPIRLVQLK